MAHAPSPFYDKATPTRLGVSIHVPARLLGLIICGIVLLTLMALASWSVDDPSFSYASNKAPENWLGFPGAALADFFLQFFGLAAFAALVPPATWGWTFLKRATPTRMPMRIMAWFASVVLFAGLLSCFAVPLTWPLPSGLGGLVGNLATAIATSVTGEAPTGAAAILYALILLPPTMALLWLALSRGSKEIVPASLHDDAEDNRPERTGIFDIVLGGLVHLGFSARTAWRRAWASQKAHAAEADQHWQQNQHARGEEPALQTSTQRQHRDFDRIEPSVFATNDDVTASENDDYVDYDFSENDDEEFVDQPLNRAVDPSADASARQSVERGTMSAQPHSVTAGAAANSSRIVAPVTRTATGSRLAREAQGSLLQTDGFELPALDLLSEPQLGGTAAEHMPDKLEENARRLEGVLEDFGVKGDIINVRPGPVVTLYELEPAPGIKSSRVISLADDIARSMSAISARVAVIPGRNAIGIELPNITRETVFLREMLASVDFEKTKGKLNICLGKTIGGEPIIADLARMPHLLVAGTTGSGKSVAINTMILSLLYKMSPEQCRMIMIDPKMLELSVYDGIPHLLTPVVTDPSKAVVALKWAVREMEDRYRKMSKIGVRNIDGFNTRVKESIKKGEVITRTVQTGFNKETGEAIYESEQFDLQPLPFIVVIVDEMADLMMVAGKDIEGAIQRLAQMARAAGIHIITATQRPSVDVITGTIKANFPTRISFQVTSKIDSRTILGEQGAEQLLGMGDMLYMAGGGRIRRLHGPFVSDMEVEDVVAHLKSQGQPDYLESITEEEDDEFDPEASFGGSGDELYDKAVNIVLNDQKASTSYIQRRLSIGYNRAATLIEKMEREGVISPANHAGKREILVGEGAAY